MKRNKGNSIASKYCLVFLGELMNIGIINSFSFINILFDLIHEAEKTIEESNDYYLFIVISTIPYLVRSIG